MIWSAVLEQIKKDVLPTVYDLWFADTHLVEFDSERAIIEVSSNLKRDVIEKRYSAMIKSALAETIGFEVELCVRTASNYESPSDSSPQTANKREKFDDMPTIIPPSVAARPVVANSEYTFENFVVGSSNKFAHAASVAVATNPASVYNPLFIYGSSGLGKTHLLYAIMNQVKGLFPDMNVIYVKGEEFLNELVACIQNGTTVAFRQKYRRADVLLIDDIQFIAGKESVQEEFFHTFNTLYEDRKQIILAADRPPKDMKTLENRLKTRFEWGLIADIQLPDFELRTAIMQNKAAKIGVEIPNDVLHYLAENLRSNIRQLEGAVKKICAQSFLNGVPVTVELAKSCINDMLVGDASPSVTAEKVIAKVADKYGISVADIKSRKKTKEIANARHICIYIIKRMTTLSYPAIGDLFERDHSTIMSSYSVIETQVLASPLLEVEIEDIIREIREE